MNCFQKTWNWIGLAFVVLGVIGGMITLFLMGLSKYSADFVTGIALASSLAFVFGAVVLALLNESSNEKHGDEEPEAIAE